MPNLNYFFDPNSGYASGSLPIVTDPVTGETVHPANTTLIAPPTDIPAGSVAIWQGLNGGVEEWVIKDLSPTPPAE